ncbi:MAG: hypothetical protein NTU68_04365 [Actinobacteria bacterium]|nr:hypothetical protein [Actinomycetota bacterium]
MRIINMMGTQMAETIAAIAPEAEVVSITADETIEPNSSAQVLCAAWPGHSIYEQLDAMGVLWMHLPGTGIDAWDPGLLRGRIVTCSRGVSAIPISEFVMGSILAVEKNFPSSWLTEPPEHWNLASLGELAGQTLGIVGMGGIGTAVAKRALAFDLRVRVLRRQPAKFLLPGVEIAHDLSDLLASADHLVLAAPSTSSTRHLLNSESLALAKPGIHIVNIARGELIDQEALRDALDDGRVRYASLDTVYPEPLPVDHWLYSHPRVHLSAHVSWSSPRAFERIRQAFAVNLVHFMAGEPLEGVVEVDEGY